MRELNTAFVLTRNMSSDFCVQFCTGVSAGPDDQRVPYQNAFQYAGLGFGTLCMCGNSIGSYGRAPDERCNITCSSGVGNCGGNGYTSVWRTWAVPNNQENVIGGCLVKNSTKSDIAYLQPNMTVNNITIALLLVLLF
ncbi:hypothetical protein HK096_004260, partial [Nowakowskiella sp. JEL0078]